MKQIRVVALNMLDDKYLRDKRLQLACQEIERLKPDVLMLQEVLLKRPVLNRIKGTLPSYHLSTAARGGRYSGYGLVTLTRQKPLKTEELRLSQKRVALKTSLKIKNRQIDFVNVHLFFSPVIDRPRQRQVKQVLRFANHPCLIAGDFNALSRFRSIRLIKRQLISAYQAVHGHEPVRTYPTPLPRGRGIRHSLRRSSLKVLGLAGKSPNGWGGTIDYIFVDEDIRVKKCKLAFTQPSRDDKTLFTSDHYGLVADISVP